MTARSVLASALLGEDPPELAVGHLVHLAGLFGISGNRARVALSRMVATGEATTDGAGRYRLAGHLLGRRDRQRVSLEARTRPWAGGWHMVVIVATGQTAEDRSGRRRRLALARLAEQREGVWLRPDNLDLAPDPGSDPGVAGFTSRPLGDGPTLAASLWDLSGWAARALRLVEALEASPTEGPEGLAPGFELSATVLRHFQADPLLPDDLLAEDWPGPLLRRTYDGWDHRYRAVLAAWGRGR
jgi:phenylacetic acid degradation operon negative regulatory protein